MCGTLVAVGFGEGPQDAEAVEKQDQEEHVEAQVDELADEQPFGIYHCLLFYNNQKRTQARVEADKKS